MKQIIHRNRCSRAFQLHYWYLHKVLSSNHFHDEMYLIQHYVIKFVSDLRQVGGFLHQ